MSNICERAVHINFDRDERELASRDTFMVLTGPDPTPPSSEGRRMGDVYLCNVDPVTRSFDGAWYFAGERDGWKAADAAELRAHVIAHPGLANRILSISPDGTSVNWSKRDTIVRRERRARTLSRSGLPPTPTPPPVGSVSAPVSPQRNIAGRRPAPLDPTAFVFPHPVVLFPPRTPPSSPPRLRPSTSPQSLRTPATPMSPRYPTTPQSARSPMTPLSSRSSRSPWSSPGSPGTPYTPDTSRETSPRTPGKYTVPQKRPSIPPPPAFLDHQVFLTPPLPPSSLAPVAEMPESADDIFAPSLPAFRPDAPPFVPRPPAPPSAPVCCREEAQILAQFPPAVIDAIAKVVAVQLSVENRLPAPPAKEVPPPTPAAVSPEMVSVVDVGTKLNFTIRDLMRLVEPEQRPSIEEEILRRPPGAAPSPSATTSSNPSATRS